MWMLAKIKTLRVSLISGDVHLATTGRLYSYPKRDDLARDFRFMPQIVSSAIANPPPPDGLVGVLHLLGRAGFTNKYTRNKMCKLFDAEGKHRLLNRRNWCEVWELDAQGDSAVGPLQPGQPALPGALVFSLRVETFDPKKGQTADDAEILEYQTVAPPLEKPAVAAGLQHGKAAHPTDLYGRKEWRNRFKQAAGAKQEPAPALRAQSLQGRRPPKRLHHARNKKQLAALAQQRQAERRQRGEGAAAEAPLGGASALEAVEVAQLSK
ncbi:hypothetical protein MNEG_9441 [Monoraphidium neglectum]|uniref:PhoD-like phosphatase domain-containing protein n=1 Tax=Monoraphidium neglectum TaxID=145388 RepID=A0A0D2MCG9_9CHLO|nr:hypothetical protein MNEG_9441 [Monoraphidium neglectum]KIY98521.1 hypothetical protein MNEG_9441 [Monoraphidium neglectum]|eukprot:XP_013897541.1 hypothetical protein MNEG_9441 [Monoraphidium neglectum]